MALKPEQHLHLAQLYEKLGGQLGVPAETKPEFDRKAKWHRILARGSSSSEQPAVPPRGRVEVDGEALLFSPVRLWQARTCGSTGKGRP
jgi:hypothetical protein